ncbi:MAG: secondary thiamine-phosphate synthase enzyme YjbQ [Candidatus Calescibacterium sp.]|nr:secondary thiamine-phosphate synthase enzyme YjbQ [Candidatus Calescibacterium sp.]
MKSYTEYWVFNTRKRREFIHITRQVQEAVDKSGIKEGFVLVSAMHITASVFINDNEDGFLYDLEKFLERLAPYGKHPDGEEYHHHSTGEDNCDAHLKNILVHHQVVVPITEGKLDLGPWQRIFYGEFDGQRNKKVIVKVVGF